MPSTGQCQRGMEQPAGTLRCGQRCGTARHMLPADPPWPACLQIRPLEDVYKFGHFFRCAGVKRAGGCMCTAEHVCVHAGFDQRHPPPTAVIALPPPAPPCRSPLMSEGDFEAKPSVLLLGQYSTGGLVRQVWMRGTAWERRVHVAGCRCCCRFTQGAAAAGACITPWEQQSS